MRPHFVIAIAMVAAAAAAAGAWWLLSRAPTKVSVLSVHTRRPPSSARPAASSAPVSSAAPSEPGSAARPKADALDGAAFVTDLDHDVHLTEPQRADLVRVLREMAAMQAHVDRYEDESEREQMQGKLIEQLIVRLRLVVGEEGAKGPARALRERKPRIGYE
jgi:hypothetical protein